MSVDRQSLRTGTTFVGPQNDVLDLLERVGFKTLRMKFFAVGLLWAAVTVAVVGLILYWNLPGNAGAGPEALTQGSSRVTGSIAVPALVIFALAGILVFLLSKTLSDSLVARR